MCVGILFIIPATRKFWLHFICSESCSIFGLHVVCETILGFIFYVLRGWKLINLEKKMPWHTFLYSSIDSENIYPYLWVKTKGNLILYLVDILTYCKPVTLTKKKLSLRKTMIHRACLSYKTILGIIWLAIWPTYDPPPPKKKQQT
jgi:hypothetical protein